MTKLFGTDGIRGRSGSFPIDGEGARKIGAAIARSLTKLSPSAPSVVIGRDTRKCGGELQENLCLGLSSLGVGAVCAGVCPTPAVVSLLLAGGADAGIMISASHNPPQYNGFKVFNSEGMKIPESLEDEIQGGFEKMKNSPPPSGGAAPPENSAWREIYSSGLNASVPGGRDLSGVKVSLDCANGATSEIAPEVFDKTGAKITSIGREPDGNNINSGCGSLDTERLGEEVRRSGAAFGAALDGDGDRIAFCDERGNEVDGDLIIALFAREMLESGKLKKPRVVTTVMSNKGLELFLEDIGIEVVRTDVGDRNVAEMMKKEAVNFGGEKSGHLIFSDHSTNGDGLLSALLAADILKKKNTPLSGALPEFELFPQVLKNVRVARREPFASMDGLSSAVARREKQLGKSGRIHIRYSGTEPLARVLVEGENAPSVMETADEISEIIDKNAGERS
ncbi:MAG: phosphoglucosamine mutase [Thermodesulfobacteriota bacterium]